MRIPSALLVLLLCAWPASTAWGQSHSAGHSMVAGTVVGGGGRSSSPGHLIAGGVPPSAAGRSYSAAYGMTGGVASVVGASGAVFSYDAAPVEIVPIAGRTLSIAYLGSASAAGTFYYRPGGQTSYLSADMTDGPGTVLAYDLPAGLLTVRGLEYYFEVDSYGSVSFLGTPDEPYAFVTEMTNAQGRRPTALPDARYAIVGLPIETDSHDAAGIFVDDLGAYDITEWRLGRYDAALDSVLEYPDLSPVYPGRGYWMIARGSARYGAPGRSMRPSLTYRETGYRRIPLDMGWTQVANPFPFDIAWADVLFEDPDSIRTGHPAELVDDAAYRYDGTAYAVAATLPAWDGFFVYAKESGVNMLVPYLEAAPPPGIAAARAASADNDGWTVALELEAGGLADAGNLAGVSLSALAGVDDMDLAEPPPPPGGPSLSFLPPGGEGRRTRTDIRPPFAGGATWDISIESSADGALRVSGLDRLPDGMSAWLEMDGSTILLSENEPVRVSRGDRSARLVVGTDGYLGERDPDLPPSVFRLEQNYPNPFNPETRIVFSIPEPGNVRLSIYDIAGRKIRALIDSRLPAGRHVAEWNGTDGRGGRVSSGIYLYRIEYGDTVDQRKMVLLR